MIIVDLWPACACRGGSPQMLEHDSTMCSVIPDVMHRAMAENRPLTDEELSAIDEAGERAISRGYKGGKIDAPKIIDAGGATYRHALNQADRG